MELSDIVVTVVEASPVNICSHQSSSTSTNSTKVDGRHTIRCFNHCSLFVYCFELPERCPVCNGDILTTEMLVPPFLVEPATWQACTKIAITIKPSKGKSFWRDYSNGDCLHCGIYDGQGTVYDFDEDGVHIGPHWINSLYVPVSSESNIKEFLEDFSAKWKESYIYDAKNQNCFDFVLQALQSFGLFQDLTKEEFISQKILPESKKAARHIALYRKLVDTGGLYVKQTNTPNFPFDS